MSLPVCTPVAHALRRALLATGLLLPVWVSASPAGDALRQLSANRWVERTTTLEDLGVGAPVVLIDNEARQEFFLPMPQGLRTEGAAFHFEGRYAKAEAGASNLMLRLDGVPLATQSIPAGDGIVNRRLDVPPGKAATGFLRVGVDWRSDVALRRCESNRATANALTILPQSRLNYRYDADSITTLNDAWIALPGATTLLVSGQHLEQDAYDSAWRVGVALERGGKRARVRVFPSVGDEVDTRRLRAPVGLESVPAIAAIAGSDKHKLANAAEIGALLLMNASAVNGDVAIADTALTIKLNQALDALQEQFASDVDALQAFKTWRQERAGLATAPMQSGNIALTGLGAHPVIAIAQDAGARAAGVFDAFWRGTLRTDHVQVANVSVPGTGKEQDYTIRLGSLGGSSDSFDVVARGDWTSLFLLGSIAQDGRMPEELVLDVAAAPGASSTRPVASVFWNGILVGARQLEAHGRPERLNARIPGYVLGVTNTVRVSFQRQPVSVDCNEIPQGYPVNVLPSSFVRTGAAEPDGSFLGLLPLIAGHAQLIVPERYLATAPATIGSVVRLAMASGLSPVRADLTVAAEGQVVKPTKPFIGMEVAIDGIEPRVVVTGGKQLRVGGKDMPWLDIAGLQRLSSAEVVSGAGHSGILWSAIGTMSAPALEAPFLLNRGDIALIGSEGPVAWVDTSNPSASQSPSMGSSAFYAWRRYFSWGVPLVSVGLFAFILLLILARRASRKRGAAK